MIARNSTIRVNGARTNNLKNISVEIPKNQMVVITGVSGSGKSSLAIDTIFAEGQRQYIESLSLYSRQFFEQNSSTDVDSIEGLQPTVCINQRRGAGNPRSTVGTTTEIYDFLRLLFAKIGCICCPSCNRSVAPQTIEQIISRILQLPLNSKAMILAPLVSGRKGQHKDVFETIRKERLVRVRIDGELHDIDRLPGLNPKQNHSIDAVADRIIVKDGIENRLFESLEMAAKLSAGAIAVSYKPPDSDDWQELTFSTRNACPNCGESCPPISTRTFSFNSPYGACQSCDGLGEMVTFDPDRVISDKTNSVAQAVLPWRSLSGRLRQRHLTSLGPVMSLVGVDENTPLTRLNDRQWNILLHHPDKKAPGLLVLLEKEYSATTDEDRFDLLESFRGSVLCQQCEGSRLNRFGNSVFVDGRSISAVCQVPLSETIEWLDALQFDGDQHVIAAPVLAELKNRIGFLIAVGLGYLSLSRSADSLSGGELQRTRLAKSIGSGLTGVCYVLDEPSIGLHSRDNERLIETMLLLKARTNTLIVVEHDEAIMWAADQIIDIGPKAGADGGRLVIQGTAQTICDDPQSSTGDYLAKRRVVGKDRAKIPRSPNRIVLKNASGFNLKSIDLEIPIGMFTCVSGVSGSGKSTLIYRTLAPALKEHFGLVTESPFPFEAIEGLETIQRLVEIDQRPISRTPRGCAATYTGIFDDIRKIFASTKLAKQLGFTASRFSFNSKQGWCAECEGHGIKRIGMKFMPDVHVECPTCKGSRYNEKTLMVSFAGQTIADVLNLSIERARESFDSFSRISEKLECLCAVGLGYLTLGQPSTSLSGGEAQRIKLATELSKRSSVKTLYLMDEPTTGLHFQDIEMLIKVVSSLVGEGNTVVIIEHNLDVIACADWVIDVGPGAGESGGEIVASCPPQELANIKRSITGRCLKNRSF